MSENETMTTKPDWLLDDERALIWNFLCADGVFQQRKQFSPLKVKHLIDEIVTSKGNGTQPFDINQAIIDVWMGLPTCYESETDKIKGEQRLHGAM